jgi:L-threonylcarbamoyladenylate synthase
MYYNWREKTNTEELKVICNLIKNGELVIFPTETVYGIGANALDKDAVSKIFIAKGRPADNPLIVHIADKRDIEKYVREVTPVEQKLIDTFMPGPFTLILPKKDIIPDIVSGGLDTIGIRMPSNVIARGIISFSGVPVAAPSANVSGKPSGTSIDDIRKELEGRVSAIIDGGETEIGLESTVVKVIHEIPVILRPGKVTDKDIIDAVGIAKYDNKIFEKVTEEQIVESPGMKYKHYAPETKCKMVYCEDELDQIFYINRYIRQYKGDVVLLSFDEHREKIVISDSRFISLGSKDNLEEIAKNIYSALRKADSIKAEVILIEGVKREGIGIAIMNRLLRAAGYDILEK